MADIAHTICIAVKNNLVEACQTLIDPEDPTYAKTVKFGRYTGNLNADGSAIAIQPGNSDKTTYRTGIIPIDEFASDMGIYFPHREIGPGQWWLMNGTCFVGVSFNKRRSIGEEEASEIAHTILSRVEKAISDTDVAGLVDDVGKQAMMTLVYARDFIESGVDPEITWKGTVYWAAVVYVPFT